MSNDCITPVYPYGSSLRLLYSGNDVTFTSTAGNFRSESGKDKLLRHGYDRIPQPSTMVSVEPSLMGSPLVQQVPYKKKYQMAARLQMLTDLQLETAIAIFELSHANGALITLHDLRLVTREPSPRTRAKVGTVTNPQARPNMEYYFAQYRVWVTQWSEPYRMMPGFNYLDFEAIEVGAPIAPGVANDLP